MMMMLIVLTTVIVGSFGADFEFGASVDEPLSLFATLGLKLLRASRQGMSRISGNPTVGRDVNIRDLGVQ